MYRVSCIHSYSICSMIHILYYLPILVEIGQNPLEMAGIAQDLPELAKLFPESVLFWTRLACGWLRLVCRSAKLNLHSLTDQGRSLSWNHLAAKYWELGSPHITHFLIGSLFSCTIIYSNSFHHQLSICFCLQLFCSFSCKQLWLLLVILRFFCCSFRASIWVFFYFK